MCRELWFGKYHYIRQLSHKLESDVYLVDHVALNQRRIIKTIKKSNVYYHLQLKEIYVLKSLNHMCIPTIYDIEEDEERIYLVEEYMEGESLDIYYTRNIPLSEQTILSIAIQLCDIIQYLHSLTIPLLYLDLKPDNILICNHVIKLIDFGSAMYKTFNTNEHHFGTKGYAAPELYSDTPLNERCDIYSLGMVLYFLISGKTDLVQDHIENVMVYTTYSKQLRKVIANCLKHSICERDQTIMQLRKKLVRLCTNNDLNNEETKKSYTIGLVGAQERIGVTHLAINLLSFLLAKKKTAIYVEWDDITTVSSFADTINTPLIYYTIISYKECYFTSNLWIPVELLEGYQYVIYDFGEVDENTIQKFYDADIKIAVFGGKVWELANSQNLINKMQEHNQIKFVSNFIDHKDFRKVIQRKSDLMVYRMPLDYQPFARKKTKAMEVFLEELIGADFNF